MENNNNQNLVSVIVPVYNILDCLERCVDSLLAQTYKKMEILLVDDGSTDGTGTLCDQLAEKDSRIRVFHKENGGSSSARNLGILQARGGYLGFVDSDDYVEPDMYERLLEVLRQHQGLMAQVGRNEIDAQGNRLPDICVPPPKLEAVSAENFLRELLLHRGDCSFCTKLIHRSLFFPEDASPRLFPEGMLNEDFYLMIQMLSDLPQIWSLPGYCYHVFYRIGSNTRKQTKEEFSPVFVDIVNNADMVYDKVVRDFPQLESEAIRFNLYQRLDYLLHIPISRMTGENRMYRQVVAYLRAHRRDICCNPWLTRKNRVYLMLFATAPRTVRRIHRMTMKVRKLA